MDRIIKGKVTNRKGKQRGAVINRYVTRTGNMYCPLAKSKGLGRHVFLRLAAKDTTAYSYP